MRRHVKVAAVLVCACLGSGSSVLLESLKSSQGTYPFSFVLCTLLVEVLKCSITLLGMAGTALMGPAAFSKQWKVYWEDVTLTRSVPYIIPALIYASNNNLVWIIFHHIHSPVTYQVFMSLEVVWVGLLSNLVLRRPLTRIQWFSALLLADGVAACHIATSEDRGSDGLHFTSFPLLAVILVLISGTLSALAGIYTELIMKRQFEQSLWVQNAQLYTYGILMNAIMLAANERRWTTLFRGFSVWVWINILVMVGSGLVVSVIIKHQSNVVKVYTTSTSLFLTTILSSFLFAFNINVAFVLAAITVSVSIMLYKGESSTPPPSWEENDEVIELTP